jgi:peptidoglycan/xylan/chitin deacetylase (PgdA/CDA1 family)
MKRIPVLMYHDMIDAKSIKDADKFTTVSLSKFIKDINYIKDHYTTILVDDLWKYVTEGIDIPDNCIMITFDDGYRSFYQYAYPILKAQQIKATMSLIVSKILNPQPKEIPKLTWDQIKEMYDSGYVDFQSHSYDMHYWPTKFETTKRLGCLQKCNESLLEYQSNIRHDYLRSKYEIENKIHNHVISYFFPYGKYSIETNSILSGVGCNVTFMATNLQEKKPNIIYRQNQSSLYNIDRIIIYNDFILSESKYLNHQTITAL